uniref:Uncharacterized protein n=1 Tax=Neogobius melanostomus TaxID=47308 RepID=A0A8C6SCM6_9GOBI
LNLYSAFPPSSGPKRQNPSSQGPPCGRVGCGGLHTCEAEDEDADGDGPGHSAVALSKVLHKVTQEHPQALQGPIGAHLHHEEGQGDYPAPPALRDGAIHLGTEAGLHRSGGGGRLRGKTQMSVIAHAGLPHVCRSSSEQGTHFNTKK